MPPAWRRRACCFLCRAPKQLSTVSHRCNPIKTRSNVRFPRCCKVEGGKHTMGPRSTVAPWLVLAAALLAGAAGQRTPDLQVGLRLAAQLPSAALGQQLREILLWDRRGSSESLASRTATQMRMASAAAGISAARLPAGQRLASSSPQVLHVNDIHAHYDPSDVNFGTCNLEGGAPVCFGGIARLASALAEAKAEGEAAGMDSIVLHAGDQFTGGEGMGAWLGYRSCQRLLAARCQVGCDGFGRLPQPVHACAAP